MKGLKLWQVLVLCIIVVVIAGGTYGIYYWVTRPETSSLSSDVQLVQVQSGNITNTVSSSGSLVFPISEELTFGSAGVIDEVAIAEGDIVEQGQLLAKFDDASLIPLQQAVVQASINLRDALDTSQAEINVATAKIALETSQQNLENAENPYSESDIIQAELAYTNAKIALANAQEDFDNAEERYFGNPTVPEWIQDYELAKVKLALAESNLRDAEESMAEVQSGADPVQVELKRKELEVAQANLDKAEDELAAINGTVTSLEGKLKQLQIEEAQIALDTATGRLESATMLAPFNGLVTAVNITAGQSVSGSTVAVTVVDPSIIEVSAVLDEIDVPLVQIGQGAIVSLSSLSDLELSGEVSSISAAGQTQSGVVTYKVTIRFTPPVDVQLREGMSATADIVVEDASNILLIPSQAVTSNAGISYVQVMVNGEIQQRVVELGLTDGYYDEVVSGLQLGEQVVLQTTASSSTTTQQSSQGIIFPETGNFPGGGGFMPR